MLQGVIEGRSVGLCLMRTPDGLRSREGGWDSRGGSL